MSCPELNKGGKTAFFKKKTPHFATTRQNSPVIGLVC